MKALRWFILAAALTGLSFQYMGCSAIMGNIPAVLMYVQDAQLVVGAIETFVNGLFSAGVKPELQKPVNIAIARTKAALDAVLRAGAGAEKLNQADVDAAFKEFQLAYMDLVNLVAPLGVSTGGGALKAVPGGLTVPTPMLLMRKP